MSLALIQESAKEARRLAIAGSPLAVGDFRLKKLIAPLEQAGAKVPVFAQVAKAISDVVNGKEADSAPNLLNLSTLLNAILYTQGQSGATGDIQKLETFSATCTSTRTPARQLKPIIEALSSSGGGRFEVIKSATERGAFNDLRLVDPAIRALGDSYPELADLVAEKIVPSYGPGIIPRLKQTFDVKGKKQEARKLEVMHRLDAAGTLDLCKKALEDGSVEVKVSAVACLGNHEECVPLLIEQAGAKNKEVRAAALEALAAHDRPEITKIFSDLVKGKALDILVRPFRALRNQAVLNSLLDEGRRVHELILKGDSEVIPRFIELLSCLGQRKESDVEAFLTNCLSNSDKLAKLKPAKNNYLGGPEVLMEVANGLEDIGTPKALETVLAKRDVLPLAAFPLVLRTALRAWSPEQVFTEFSPLLGQTKGAAKEKKEQLQHYLEWAHWREMAEYDPLDYDESDHDEANLIQKVVWDPRWLDAAVKANESDIVCCLARSNHKAALNYLLKLLEAKNKNRPFIVKALARCQYPKTTDVYLDLVAKGTKGSKRWDYELQHLIESARFLPPESLPRLEEFAAKLDENYVDHFLEAIAPLRRTNQPTQA